MKYAASPDGKTMLTYFDLLFSKNLDKLLDLVDTNIEWLIVPMGANEEATSQAKT